MIAPTFGHFGPFPAPGPILASPHRAPHHPPPHPAAFYPHPLVYWPYPSPPVSPTTYFNQPTHSPTHVPGSHGPPLYSLDYIPAVQTTSYANPASPLSPPTVAIPTNPSGIILSPNKAPTMTLMPTPKQYPTVVPGPPTAIAPITSPYHNKMTLQPTHPPLTRHTHTNFYHQYSSPTGAVLAVQPPPAAAAVAHTPPCGISKTSPADQPLLAIDTSHAAEPSAPKTNTKTTNSSIPPSQLALNATKAVVSTDAGTSSHSSTTPTMNGVVAPIVTNHCVELYTS